jgi:hypothetical protein
MVVRTSLLQKDSLLVVPVSSFNAQEFPNGLGYSFLNVRTKLRSLVSE